MPVIIRKNTQKVPYYPMTINGFTVSAPVKLMPKPPLRVDRIKQKIFGSELKRSMSRWRFSTGVDPSKRKYVCLKAVLTMVECFWGTPLITKRYVCAHTYNSILKCVRITTLRVDHR